LKIDLNIAAVDPAELLKSLPERLGAELSFRNGDDFAQAIAKR
jgi:hypothetical protein